jgi:hypothetical protein
MTVQTRLAETHPDVTQRAYYDLNPVGTRHYTSQLFIRHRDPLALWPILDAVQRQYAFINPKDDRANLHQHFGSQKRGFLRRYVEPEKLRTKAG